MEETNKKSILVISAHADDHIACAGTVFKLRNMGYTPYEIVLTNSNEGPDYRPDMSTNEISKMRTSELSKASNFLGIQKTYLMNQDDLGLTYSKNLMFSVVSVIREVRPTIGIIMSSFDWHPDHRAANQIGSEAFKWANSGVRPELGKQWKTTMVLCAEGMLPVLPNILVDISKFEDKKRQLWEIYESQARPEAVAFDEAMHLVRGYQLKKKGSLFAEAFTTDPTSPVVLFDEP